MSRLVEILDGLDAEIEGAQWIADGSRGQHVPFHGDFAGVPLSALGRLAWWARELRGAACEPCDCANRFLDSRTRAAAEARLRAAAEAVMLQEMLLNCTCAVCVEMRAALAPPVRPCLGDHKGFRDRDVDGFNASVPSGTPVRFWRFRTPWCEPVETRTRSAAWALGDGNGVVLVEGIIGGVAISHVEVVR